MIKSKTVTLFFALIVVFVTSCNIENNSDLDDSIKELQTNQKNIQEKMIVLKEIQTNQVNLLKKIQTIEKSISTLATQISTKTQKNPKADPNKVYSAKIGNSFIQGNKNAKVTIIEWADYF